MTEFVAVLQGNVREGGGANMDTEEVRAICESYDADGNAEIDFEEFLNMFHDLFLQEAEKEARSRSHAAASQFLAEDAAK